MTPALLVAAAAALAGAGTHDIVPDDQFTLDGVKSLDVSRTGAYAAYVRDRWAPSLDRRHEDVWVVAVRNGRSSRLTFTDADANDPAISSDDAWVYFRSADGDDASQVFRVPLEGGAVQQITRVPGGVAAYALDDTDGAVWFVTHEERHGDDRWEAQRDAWPDLHYVGRRTTVSRVHRLDLATWRTDVVWSPERYVVDFAPSPDGQRVAAVTAPDDDLVTHEGWSDVRVLQRGTDGLTVLPDAPWRADAPSPYGWLFGLAWASDSRALAFRVDYDGYPGEAFVAEFAGDEPEVWQVPRPGGVSMVGEDLAWAPGTRELCYRAAEHARVRVVCVPRLRSASAGRLRAFPQGDVVVGPFSFSGDGRDLIAVVGTPTGFPDIYRFPARGNLFPQQVTDVNPHTAAWKLPRLQVVSWTAPDGTPVEGILETPHGWTKDDGPLPMVVQLHGGPTSHTPYALSMGPNGRTVFPSKGWALFSPNYRGSIGYGDTFLTDLVGREADVEVADILAGVDAMVAAGIADADRLAVMGWSNGGFLTAAVLTTTDRFKAASLGAGVVDQTLQWALEDTPGHVVNFMKGLPWETPDAYRAASPLLRAAAIRTPTLIHFGEDDARVPLAHGKALFRALDTYLGVPSELVVYPGAGHGLDTRSARAAKTAWDLAWFEAHAAAGAQAPLPLEQLPAEPAAGADEAASTP